MKSTLLFLFIFNNLLFFSQTPEWHLEKNEDGIQVYTQAHSGSNILEFKAITTINTSIENVEKIILDIEHSKSWLDHVVKSKILKKKNKNDAYVYYEIEVPWPLENRDLVVEQKITKQTPNIFFMSVSSVSKYYPKQDNITRIKIAKGYWKLIKLQTNKTKLVYSFYSDPAGNIPSWIVNMFIVDSPYKTLKKLNQMFN